MLRKKTDVLNTLYSKRNNPHYVLSLLKKENYKDCKKNIRKSLLHPLTKKIIFSSSLPKSYTEIRDFKGLAYSDNFEGELAWITFSIMENFEKVNRFIKMEQEIEDAVLRNDFQKAKGILDSVNENVCFSYWGLEIEYFLIETLHGTESNWSFNNEISKDLKNRLSIIFSQIFSKKVESGWMTNEYSRYIDNLLKNSNVEEFEYFGFKFSKHQFKKFSNFPFLLYAESHSSVIDKYLIVVNVFQEIVSSNLLEYYPLIIDVSKELLTKITDNRLIKILEIIDPLHNIQQNSNPLIEILELYSIGKYTECIDKCIQVFPQNINSIELWDLYIKSLVELSEEFRPTNCSEFLDKQLTYLYNIYTLTDIYEDGLQNIRKIIISLPHFKFSKQLNASVNSILDRDFTDKYFNVNYYLNSSIINPIIFSFKANINSNIEFSNLVSSRINRYINNTFDGPLPSSIPELKKKIYHLRREYNNSIYVEYLSEFNSLSIDSVKVSVIKEELIFKAYNSHFENGNINSAISLYIEAYFENINLVKRIDTNPIITQIIDRNYDIVGDVDTALFFTIEELEPYHQFVMLEMFLDANGLKYPSELVLEKDKEDYFKLIYLLSKTCTEEVLDKFYLLFDYKEEVRAERKNILIKLIQTENEKNDDYITELSIINQQEKLEALVSKINNSRISLKREMLTDGNSSFENTYNRFVKLFKFSNENSLNQHDLVKLLTDFLSESVDETTFDPAYLSFRALINDIIGNFLFNKYSGLDGELSTRIRHGELENQLLNVLDKQYLISKKEDDNNYTDIEYWNSVYNDYEEESINDIQKALKDFSKEIDNIIQYLIKDQIQVYSENYPDKPNALFNFRFTDQFLKIVYEEVNLSVNTYEELIDYLFNLLTVITRNNLKEIQEYLNEKLLKAFEKLTEVLLGKLIVIEDKHAIQIKQLKKNIIDLKTDFQNELMNITDWFKLSKDDFDDSMDVETLIKTSFEMSNLRNSLNPLNPSLTIESDSKIFIKGFNNFIFIFLNVIDNIRKHSKLRNDQLIVNVKIIFKENTLSIKFNNNFSNEINTVELAKKLEVIKDNWGLELDDDKLKSEGGTGFEKIKRILRHNIKSPSTFDYQILPNSLDIHFSIQLVKVYGEKDLIY